MPHHRFERPGNWALPPGVSSFLPSASLRCHSNSPPGRLGQPMAAGSGDVMPGFCSSLAPLLSRSGRGCGWEMRWGGKSAGSPGTISGSVMRLGPLLLASLCLRSLFLSLSLCPAPEFLLSLSLRVVPVSGWLGPSVCIGLPYGWVAPSSPPSVSALGSLRL